MSTEPTRNDVTLTFDFLAGPNTNTHVIYYMYIYNIHCNLSVGPGFGSRMVHSCAIGLVVKYIDCFLSWVRFPDVAIFYFDPRVRVPNRHATTGLTFDFLDQHAKYHPTPTPSSFHSSFHIYIYIFIVVDNTTFFISSHSSIVYTRAQTNRSHVSGFD